MTQGQIAGGDEDGGKGAGDGLEPVFPPRSSPDPRTVTGLWYVATGRYGNRGRTPGYWSRLWAALRGRTVEAPAPARPFGLTGGGGLHHLAQRQRSQRDMGRQARTGALSGQRAGHRAAVGFAPLGQETVQQRQPLGPAAALAVRAGIGGKAQGAGRGNLPRLDALDAGQRGRGQGGRLNMGIAPGLPAVAAFQPPHHA